MTHWVIVPFQFILEVCWKKMTNMYLKENAAAITATGSKEEFLKDLGLTADFAPRLELEIDLIGETTLRCCLWRFVRKTSLELHS